MGEKSRPARVCSMREAVYAGEDRSRGGMPTEGSGCSRDGDAAICELGKEGRKD